MNRSNYYISLDIRDSYGACLLDMKQADTHRRLHITLTDGGLPYLLTPGCYPVFTAKRPDGTGIFNTCTVEDNTVIYDITLQDTAAVGLLRCELRLYDGALELDGNGIPEISDKDVQLLTCAAFSIQVHPTVYDDNTIPASKDELTALTRTLADARSTIQAVLDAKNSGQFNGPQGVQGPQGAPGAKGEKGDTGAPGKDGYTPVRGVDYWTAEDQKQFEAALAEKAEIHNDTVGPDAWSSKVIIDRLCPGFNESGWIVSCAPVEGYPLEVVSQITPSTVSHAALTLHHTGKNILYYPGIDTVSPTVNATIIEILENGIIAQGNDGNGTGSHAHSNGFFRPGNSSYDGAARVHLKPGMTVTLSADYTVLEDPNGYNITTRELCLGTRDVSVARLSKIVQTAALGVTKRISGTFTIVSEADYYFEVSLNACKTRIENLQIEIGSSATEYEPYIAPNVFTVDLGSTCYGGSFVWSTGELTVTHTLSDAGELTELTTPQVVQLDPQRITANAGVNTLYSSTGSTRVSGKTDPVSVIEKLSTRLAALEDAAI